MRCISLQIKMASNMGNSGSEEKFLQIFYDVFGPEKAQYVYTYLGTAT